MQLVTTSTGFVDRLLLRYSVVLGNGKERQAFICDAEAIMCIEYLYVAFSGSSGNPACTVIAVRGFGRGGIGQTDIVIGRTRCVGQILCICRLTIYEDR
jgi:hypothetical protein